MPGPESFHSSLKSCDLYDNPYNTQLQAHPAIVKQRKTAHHESDTISSAQGKLERELFEAFKQNSFNLLSGKMLILGKVGKYAFLAIMLPVYLFFYGIPKWIFSEFGPNSFHFTKKIFSKVGSRIAEAASHIAFGALSIVRKVTDPILNFINTHIEKGREFYLNTKQKWIKLANWPKKWIAQLFKPFVYSYNQISHSFSKISQNFSRLVKAIHRYSLAIREAFINFPQKTMELLQSILNMGKQKLSQFIERMQPIINILQKLDAKLSSVAEVAKDYANQIIDRTIKQPFNSVKQQYQKFKHFSVDQFNVIKEPLVSWASPKIEKVTKFIYRVKEKVDRISERVQTRFHALSERAEEFINKLKENPSQVIQEVLLHIPQPILSLFTPLTIAFNFIRRVPSIFKEKKQSTGEKAKKFKQKIKKLIIRLNKKCLSFLQRNFAKIKPLLIFIIRKIAQLLIKSAIVAKEMLKGGFFLLRLMFAWMKILLRHGLFLVRETCSVWFPAIR